MRISKHELILSLKDHYEHDADEMAHCMVECFECDLQKECFNLDKYIEKVFEDDVFKIIEEPSPEYTKSKQIIFKLRIKKKLNFHRIAASLGIRRTSLMLHLLRYENPKITEAILELKDQIGEE